MLQRFEKIFNNCRNLPSNGELGNWEGDIMYNEDIKETLIKAISQRKPIKFRYNSPDDDVIGERIGYSHAMYINYYTGNILVDIYQTAGDSSEKKVIPEWRQFKLSCIDNIEILADKQFEVQKDYKPNSPKYKNCIAKI